MSKKFNQPRKVNKKDLTNPMLDYYKSVSTENGAISYELKKPIKQDDIVSKLNELSKSELIDIIMHSFKYSAVETQQMWREHYNKIMPLMKDFDKTSCSKLMDNIGTLCNFIDTQNISEGEFIDLCINRTPYHKDDVVSNVQNLQKHLKKLETFINRLLDVLNSSEEIKLWKAYDSHELVNLSRY